MNREVKFRGWDNHNKEWVYSKPMPDMGFWKWVSYDSTTVFDQFTGQLDNNKNEVYEGDIIKFKESNRPHVVEYKDHSFVLTHKGVVMVYNWNSSIIEVIGNIHENPELL